MCAGWPDEKESQNPRCQENEGRAHKFVLGFLVCATRRARSSAQDNRRMESCDENHPASVS